MAEVLVIGAGGFVGRHLVNRLSAEGHCVHATHRPNSPPPATNGILWHPCDLSAPDPTDQWPARCDAVYFLAQSRKWRDFPEGAPDVVRVNIHALLSTLWYSLRAGASRLIYSSTGTLYTQTSQPATEEEPIDFHADRSFYAASKLAAEALLAPYHQLLPIVSLRLFMPYGEGQSSEMLLPRLVRSVQQSSPIQLHGENGLTCNPVAIADVVEALVRCLHLSSTATLNLGGTEALTLRAIGETIGRVVGAEPRFEPNPNATPPVIVGDITRLQEALGWKPSLSFEQGLKQWLLPKENASSAA